MNPTGEMHPGPEYDYVAELKREVPRGDLNETDIQTVQYRLRTLEQKVQVPPKVQLVDEIRERSKQGVIFERCTAGLFALNRKTAAPYSSECTIETADGHRDFLRANEVLTQSYQLYQDLR